MTIQQLADKHGMPLNVVSDEDTSVTLLVKNHKGYDCRGIRTYTCEVNGSDFEVSACDDSYGIVEPEQEVMYTG